MQNHIVIENSYDLTFKKENLIKTHTTISFRDMYKCVNRLGAGSFGEVWECEHKKIGTWWAVKIMWWDQLSNGNEFEKIFKEVEILKKLDHPNIVKIYEMF